MNKETFLRELREYLKILEDREQEDILAEYAQHIDMKMQKGLSEEEAIRDFGPMEELAAEILEAYHVKPEFSKKSDPAFAVKVKDGIAGGGKFLGRAGRFMKEKFLAGVRCIGRGFRLLGRKMLAFAGWLARPFKRKESAGGMTTAADLQTDFSLDVAPGGDISIDTGEHAERILNSGENSKIIRKGTKDMAAHAGSFFGAIGHGIKTICRAVADFCIWGLKLIWNCGWIMFSLMMAFMTMITLLGFGTVLIFLVQGYPFSGILLMSLGGILCFGSLTCAAFSMIIRMQKEENKDTEKKKDNNKDDKTGTEEKEEQSGEEVQYE